MTSLLSPEEQARQEPVARLHLMKGTLPMPLYEIVILQRNKCFDGMPLYAAPSAEKAELPQSDTFHLVDGDSSQTVQTALPWTHVRDGLPPCDGETVFIGVNTSGFAACFNAMNPDGVCLMGGPESSTAQMSCLQHWRELDRPALDDSMQPALPTPAYWCANAAEWANRRTGPGNCSRWCGDSAKCMTTERDKP